MAASPPECELLLEARPREEGDEEPLPKRRWLVLVASFVVVVVVLGLARAARRRDTTEAVYWRGYEPQWNIACDQVDDDSVFTAEACTSYDQAWFCSYDCEEGTACYEVCGSACASSDSWGAYCVWDAWAQLPALCDGSFEPKAPTRRLMQVDGVTCAWHAYCAACDSGANEYCSSVYHYYFNATQSYIYTGNEQAAAALEPETLDEWCSYFDLPRGSVVIAPQEEPPTDESIEAAESVVGGCDVSRPWSSATSCEVWTSGGGATAPEVVEVKVETGLYSPYLSQAYGMWRYAMNGPIGRALGGIGDGIRVTSYTVTEMEVLSEMLKGQALPAGSVVFVDAVGNVDRQNAFARALSSTTNDAGCVDGPWQKSQSECENYIDAKCAYAYTDDLLLRSAALRRLLAYQRPLVLVITGDIGCRLRLPTQTHHRVVLANDGALGQVQNLSSDYSADEEEQQRFYLWPQGLEDYDYLEKAERLAAAVQRVVQSSSSSESSWTRSFLMTLSMSYYFRKPSRVHLQKWLQDNSHDALDSSRVAIETEVSPGSNVTRHWYFGDRDYPSSSLSALNDSTYVLCPAGDVWSTGRVLEALLLGATPIIDATYFADGGQSAKGCHDPASLYRDGIEGTSLGPAPAVFITDWDQLRHIEHQAPSFSPAASVAYVTELLAYAKQTVLDFALRGDYSDIALTKCVETSLSDQQAAALADAARAYYDANASWFNSYRDSPSAVGCGCSKLAHCSLNGAYCFDHACAPPLLASFDCFPAGD